MKYRTLIAVTALTGLLILSCSKDNEETVSGNTGGNNPLPAECVSTNMQYAAHIAPLIQTNCFACHSNANAAVSGISLEGHANLVKKVNDGRLWGAINHMAGFAAMPQGGPKLSACNISKIKAWIDAGALNN